MRDDEAAAPWFRWLPYYGIALWQAYAACLLFALITAGLFLRRPPRRFGTGRRG